MYDRKWSEILLVIMAVSKRDDLGVAMIWSIRVALERVHLVGFVTVCSKPKEKSKSINSRACSHEVYLSTLMLKSPKKIYLRVRVQ